MSIEVTQDIDNNSFPIRIIIHGNIDQKFTIKAAIELRNKLEMAISDYQVAEALKPE
jgi:hypothetical protein